MEYTDTRNETYTFSNSTYFNVAVHNDIKLNGYEMENIKEVWNYRNTLFIKIRSGFIQMSEDDEDDIEIDEYTLEFELWSDFEDLEKRVMECLPYDYFKRMKRSEFSSDEDFGEKKGLYGADLDYFTYNEDGELEI